MFLQKAIIGYNNLPWICACSFMTLKWFCMGFPHLGYNLDVIMSKEVSLLLDHKILRPKKIRCTWSRGTSWETLLEEAQAGSKIAGRNINNLRYAGDITLMAESEEELKSFVMKVRGEWKSWLKLNIQKTKIMASGPITSWQIDGEIVETVADLNLGGAALQNHCRWWLQP